MKKFTFFTVIWFALFLFSCGESDEIRSGKINACKLQEAKEKLKEDPSNETLKADVEAYQRYFEINRETAADKNAFDKAIQEHLEAGCPDLN
jgi:hypothetical protein